MYNATNKDEKYFFCKYKVYVWKKKLNELFWSKMYL